MRKLEIILRFFCIAKFPHALLINFVSKNMDGTSPIVLILGHLFICGLCHDLETGADQQADVNFNLQSTAVIFMHGMGDQTVPKLCMFDRHVVKQLSSDIIIMERETNDLTRIGPGVVGSEIFFSDDFVRFLFIWIISLSAWSAFVMLSHVFFHVEKLSPGWDLNP